MISAFLGVVFKDISKGLTGFIPIFVMMFSMVIMAVIGLIINRYKFNKLRDYALPISMLSAMGFAIFITAVIGG
jgi:branched-subunit amino acid ABC-type transport system permease component